MSNHKVNIIIFICIACLTPAIAWSEPSTATTSKRGAPEQAKRTNDNRGCAVIYGGGAISYYGGANIKADQLFYAINQLVVDKITDDMASLKFKIYKVMLEKPESGMNLSDIGKGIENRVAQDHAKFKCNTIIQVRTDFGETKQTKLFGFRVEAFRLIEKTDKSGKHLAAEEDYLRKHMYTIDQKTFDNLRPGEIAKEIFLGLQSSGALEPLGRT